MTEKNNAIKLTARERWITRVALGAMIFFTALGIYILYYPTETLIAIFGVMLVITLLLGAAYGYITALES